MLYYLVFALLLDYCISSFCCVVVLVYGFFHVGPLHTPCYQLPTARLFAHTVIVSYGHMDKLYLSYNIQCTNTIEFTHYINIR